MNSKILTSLRRLRPYILRIERDLANDDRSEALANLADWAEIARRLWNNLAKVVENPIEDEF